MNTPVQRDSRGVLLAMPSVFWLTIFFAIPILIMLGVSLLTRGSNPSDYNTPLTLKNYEEIFTEPLVSTLIRSIRIALQSTLICFVIGYPLAFFISTRRSSFVRQVCLFLVILPFWTNFLVRTYAWQVILGRRGVLNEFLMQLNLIERPLQLINTEGAVLLGLVYGFLPFMVLPIYASVERFNFRMVEAAHDLGANDWYAFWRIVFPMTLPGVVAGWILVFIPAIGAFVTPALLGGTEGFMVGNLINRQFRDNGGSWPLGSAASIVLMGLVGLSLVIYQRFANEQSYAQAGLLDKVNRWLNDRGIVIPPLVSSMLFWIFILGFVVYLFTLNWFWTMMTAIIVIAIVLASSMYQRLNEVHKTENRSYEVDRWRVARDLWVRRIGRWGLAFNPIFSYFFLWMPIVVLVVYSFNASQRASGRWEGFSTDWYSNIFQGVSGGDRSQFSTEQMLESVETSLLIGIGATIISTIIGTMVSLSLERGYFRGKKWVDALLYLPIVIPDITMGISLLLFFKVVFDAIEAITGSRPFPNITTVTIAHIAFNISFVAIVVRARLTDMNPRYEEAARDLGANEWRTFWRVTYPLLLPAIIAGALLAFTLSLDDFVITFFVSGGTVTTLTVFVWGLVRRAVPPEINAISTLMIIASTVLILLSMLLQGRNTATRG